MGAFLHGQMKQKTNYLRCKYTLLIPGSSRAATSAATAEVLGNPKVSNRPPILARSTHKYVCNRNIRYIQSITHSRKWSIDAKLIGQHDGSAIGSRSNHQTKIIDNN